MSEKAYVSLVVNHEAVEIKTLNLFCMFLGEGL